MMNQRKNSSYNSKKIITAILVAVIVLLLILIFVKGCTDSDTGINPEPTISATNSSTSSASDISAQTPSPGTQEGTSAAVTTPTENITPNVSATPDIHATPSPTPKPTPRPAGATPNDFTHESFPTSKDSDGVYSKYAYMIDLESGKVVYEKNADLAMYPASMTKIMTVILAIENIDDYDKKITMDSDFYAYLREEGASVAGFDAGDVVTADMLLYGAMLVSGAECCIQLAREVAGTEDDFYVLMNKKAKELGMLNTHYHSSTGLFHEENYTTVHDVAILMEYAIKNEKFMEIITEDKYVGEVTIPNKVLASADNFVSIKNGKFIGGKTGYIMKAGQCLASLAEIDGRQYILVTAGGNKSFGSTHFVDANYIYNNFKKF